MRPDGPRAEIVGPDAGPETPFPLRLDGEVVKGFGRGSKELGIPTANIPISGLTVGGIDDIESGVYYGWAGLRAPSAPSSQSAAVYPMVMSIGWNPYYKNTVRSVEVHIMQKFKDDFYGSHMNLIILGFIRPEYDYVSKDSLIEDIMTDIEVARRSLDRRAYEKFKQESYLISFEGTGAVAN
ncbi:riboflavin kinase [Polychaeton citri CBS 116435]|uniref:Riboflavin kinase n=1 Tax=Polychaeton citri CBS 116435 TaxID=1314669 RepID=A0A9P4UMW6_9PEZI|nr:riboflavin kinase [Polychaeton citri CBS 116435]